jgi:Putative Actinobacterial Holin-X, holin superfamily III
MPIRGNGVGAAVHEIAERARALARLETELVALELRRKVVSLGVGAALLLVGAIVALFALGFLLATIAAALATFLPTWLALLLVTSTLALGAAALLVAGLSFLRRGVPPVPTQAVEEALLTGEALRGNGRA